MGTFASYRMTSNSFTSNRKGALELDIYIPSYFWYKVCLRPTGEIINTPYTGIALLSPDVNPLLASQDITLRYDIFYSKRIPTAMSNPVNIDTP